jgi:peptidoglycan/LPS O-acetylase OafA/YrhL
MTETDSIDIVNQPKNLKYVDSIRGIAILMVILVHSAQEFTFFTDTIISKLCEYGQMGVQLFFVASAYTLCLSFKNRNHESKFLIKYGIRRFFRIAPAYYIGILIYFLIAILKDKSGISHTFLPNYSIAAVLTNILFLHGLFPFANNNIVPGGWSIGTEMLFYVVFPSLYFLSRKLTNSSITKGLLFLVATFLICQSFFIFLNTLTGEFVENNNFWYYLLLNQLPVFALGIFYFHYESHKLFQKSVISDILLFGMFTGISATLWFGFNKDYLFTLIPFISGLSFIFLLQIFKKCEKLNSRLIINIGKVSFSMYLIHFVFAYELKKVFLKKSHIEWDLWSTSAGLIIVYVFSVFASYKLAKIAYNYIEQPCINLGKRIVNSLS